MKGLSFQNGIEYKINIEGESWSQGDAVTLTLESKTPSSLRFFLAEALERKVKAKDPKAFKPLETFTSEASPLTQTIQLPLNARITDKSGGLYIVYGKHDEADTALEKMGQLRLNIIPHLLIRDLTDVFTAHFRFALKTTHAGKNDEVELKLEPSGSKEWASLEQLLVRLTVTEETIEANFQFDRNEVDPSKGGLSSKSVRREMDRTWALAEIVHDFNQRLNKEVAIAAIDSVFEEYRSINWLSS